MERRAAASRINFLFPHTPTTSVLVREQKTIKQCPACQLEFGVGKDPDLPESSPLSASHGLLGQSATGLWIKHSQDVQECQPATENRGALGSWPQNSLLSQVPVAILVQSPEGPVVKNSRVVVALLARIPRNQASQSCREPQRWEKPRLLRLEHLLQVLPNKVLLAERPPPQTQKSYLLLVSVT